MTRIGGSLVDARRTAPAVDPVTPLFGVAAAVAIAQLLAAYAGEAVATRETRP